MRPNKHTASKIPSRNTFPGHIRPGHTVVEHTAQKKATEMTKSSEIVPTQENQDIVSYFILMYEDFKNDKKFDWNLLFLPTIIFGNIFFRILLKRITQM